MAKIVHVVGGDFFVSRMFEERGWTLRSLDDGVPDLICFTGGDDVHPHWYGEEPDGNGYYDWQRDELEIAIFGDYKGKVPFVGICRGGQFLNVMNGGTLIQHLGETVSGIVVCRDLDGESHYMSVDHHQGIVRDTEKSYPILAYDAGNIHPQGPGVGITYACFYPETRSLCFQPHPEWGHEGTKELFFGLIEEFIYEGSTP